MSEREFVRTRRVLRSAGPMLVVAGGLCLIVAMVNFFASMGSFSGPPKLFWLAFIGVPMLAVGLGTTKAGYAGKIARYAGREIGPAASATFNEIADASRPGVRAIAAAVRDGVAEEGDSEETDTVRCSACGSENDRDAKFCASCGEAIGSRACGACGHPAKAGARFCDECGVGLDQ